jgi:hypothetical protein
MTAPVAALAAAWVLVMDLVSAIARRAPVPLLDWIDQLPGMDAGLARPERLAILADRPRVQFLTKT